MARPSPLPHEASQPSAPAQTPAAAGAPPAPSSEAKPAAHLSSIERVAAKESFAPDEALPAFTLPVIDEAQKQELLQRVEEARAASTAPVPPPRPPPHPTTGATKIGRGTVEQLLEAGRSWLDAACVLVDRGRSRLPERLRVPLSRVPSSVILAGLSFLALTLVVAGFSLLIAGRAEKQRDGPEHATLPTAPSEDAEIVSREIERAKRQGYSELEKLTARFPNDPRVWLELGAASSARGEHAAAVSGVAKALAADPKANEQALASDLLARAVRKRDTTSAAFELLTAPMGPSGATVVYDLSIDPDVALPLRSRAEEWIRSEAFRKVAAPDVQIAAALRYAKSCSDRHDLLPSAGEHGGRRVLDYLNIAKTPGGCGRNASKDCFPCLRKDDALKDAISSIEKRLAAK